MIAVGHRVLEVVTQPDRPQGRKQELIPSPVKQAAIRHGLPVFQPERVRRQESVEHLRQLHPDVMVVVGYGQIIPQAIIDIPKHGIINVHASLLPELRGAAPIQWAVARGFKTTGVATMRINAGLDTGDVLGAWETAVGEDETAPELGLRLAAAGADLLVRTLDELEQGTALVVPQDDAKATLAPILKKEDGRIDWRNGAEKVHNLIRGLQPWPGAHTSFRGQSLHIWRSRRCVGDGGRNGGAEIAQVRPAGTIWSSNGGVFAQAGDGEALELLEVQLEGRKRMPAAVFANGHRLDGGELLA
jgi:methionyl-tRNA formyltransferase